MATAPTQEALGNHVAPYMPVPVDAKPSDNLTSEQLAHKAQQAAKSPLARETLRKADAGDEEAKAKVAKWMPGVETAVRAAVNEEDGNENKENQNGESAGTEDQVEKSGGAEGNEQNETAEEVSKEKAPAKAEEKDKYQKAEEGIDDALARFRNGDIDEKKAMDEVDSIGLRIRGRVEEGKEDAKARAFDKWRGARKEIEAAAAKEEAESTKGDKKAKGMMSARTYNKVYKPTVAILRKAKGTAKKAAEESALLYSKMVEGIAKRFDRPVEEVAAKIQLGGNMKPGDFGMPVTEALDENKLYAAVDLDTLPDKIGATSDSPSDIQRVKDYITNQLAGVEVQAEDFYTYLKLEDPFNVNHVPHGRSQKGLKNFPNRVARNKTLSNMEAVLSHAILIEQEPGISHNLGFYGSAKHDAQVKESLRLVVPVIIGQKPMVLVITVTKLGRSYRFSNKPADLYEIYAKKSAVPDPRSIHGHRVLLLEVTLQLALLYLKYSEMSRGLIKNHI